MTRLLIALIRVYQHTLSHILGGCCRFYPTCSEYSAQAIQLHGWFRGSWLAMRRVCRCHPFNAGGLDPVPLPRRNEPRISLMARMRSRDGRGRSQFRIRDFRAVRG